MQAASVTTDRTSIRIQILPPLEQIVPAIVRTIPSTGGPALISLVLALAALGSVGGWLRYLGRRGP